jgi:hypothetical protein
MITFPCSARITFTPDSPLMCEAPEVRWQLASVLIPFQSTDCPSLTPGQVAIIAAAAEEAAEAVTREAESCKVCLDWPGLCASCYWLSHRAVSYRELAAQLRQAGRP